MNTKPIILSLLLFSCDTTETPPRTSDVEIDVVDVAITSQDVGSDPDLTDTCSPTEQSWDFSLLELSPRGDELRTYMYTVPLDSEHAHATIENGVMTIRLNSPNEGVENEPIVSLFIYNNTGALPGTHTFTSDRDGNRPDDQTIGSYSQWFTPGTSEATVSTEAGSVQLHTCPNAVGQFAFGTLDEAMFGASFTTNARINGTFSVVVTESDGSMVCAQPTICDY